MGSILFVIPAKAGIQSFGAALDSRFRGNDNGSLREIYATLGLS
jgi:hypothetical protein